MKIAIRPANVPQDYTAMAAVLEEENPGWAATAEELAHDDASRDPRYHHAAFVAEAAEGDQTLVVGVAFVELDELALGKGRFELNIRVPPTGKDTVSARRSTRRLSIISLRSLHKRSPPWSGRRTRAPHDF